MISEVYNCDCIEFMRGLPDNAFDIVIADPPYGIKRSGHNGVVAKNPRHNWKKYEFKEWDSCTPLCDFFYSLFRISKNQIIFGANYFPNFIQRSMGWIVWDKGQHGLTMSDGELAFTSFERALRIVTINRNSIKNYGGVFHPTQKPVELYSWILKNYANQGEKIFDPMMGSQSSRIAAYKLGYDYWGCELDKEYFDKGCERFEKECHGIQKLSDGTTVRQLSIF